MWLSVPFGLIITLVCFSGAMLVFENEVNEWFRRDLYYVETVKESPLPMDKLLEKINYTAQQNAVRIPTGRLNDVLAYATARVQPPSDKGRRLKIYYMTKASTKPPTFVAFVNRAELFHFSYRRYIENQIRETFGLDGTPIVMMVRERDRDDVKS